MAQYGATDDWALIGLAKQGDMDAFAELVRRHETGVIHFCQRMVRSRQDAEDLAQETFVRVYKSLGRLKERAKFTTLLFGIARNLTLNHLRDQGRRGRNDTRSLTREDETERLVADDAHRPDREARVSEMGSAIERALNELNQEHREVLVLREVQGLDYDSIARITRCRTGTVKSRLARAREQLRTKLLQHGGDAL
jgi:RNA polymerase sigma-70 factor (ECF subfamily)